MKLPRDLRDLQLANTAYSDRPCWMRLLGMYLGAEMNVMWIPTVDPLVSAMCAVMNDSFSDRYSVVQLDDIGLFTPMNSLGTQDDTQQRYKLLVDEVSKLFCYHLRSTEASLIKRNNRYAKHVPALYECLAHREFAVRAYEASLSGALFNSAFNAQVGLMFARFSTFLLNCVVETAVSAVSTMHSPAEVQAAFVTSALRNLLCSIEDVCADQKGTYPVRDVFVTLTKKVLYAGPHFTGTEPMCLHRDSLIRRLKRLGSLPSTELTVI